MKQQVSFTVEGTTLTMIGYEDATLPIDKLAQLVLSSDVHIIGAITIHYADGTNNTFSVQEREIGGPSTYGSLLLDENANVAKRAYSPSTESESGA